MGSKSWGLLLAIPMLIFSATAIYYLYKKDEDEYDDIKMRTSRCRTHEMKIPKDTIGVLIGRAGSNIKEIETKSDTRIKFNDDVTDEEFRTCIIRGSNEAVQLAELLIHDCIMSQPLIETFEMWVPKRAMGRIIGKCGESIKAISRASCAKVSADSNSAPNSGENRIILKGTAEQIAVAKSLIEEKVEEDIEMRKKFDERTANRYPRSKPVKALSNVSVNADLAGTSEKHSTEKLESVVSDGSMQIFVSAVSSPKKFWVQNLENETVKLLQRSNRWYTIHSPWDVPNPFMRWHYSKEFRNRELQVFIEPDQTLIDENLEISPLSSQCYSPYGKQLDFFKYYTHQNCKMECLTSEVLNECGCVMYYMPHNESTDICLDISCPSRIIDKVNVQRSLACDCLSSCNQTDYKFVSHDSIPDRDSSKLITVFIDDIFYPQIRRESGTIENFIETSVTYLDMFLGLSLVSIVEILYYSILMLLECFNVEQVVQDD